MDHFGDVAERFTELFRVINQSFHRRDGRDCRNLSEMLRIGDGRSSGSLTKAKSLCVGIGRFSMWILLR